MKKRFSKYIFAVLFCGALTTSCNAQKQKNTTLNGYTMEYDFKTGCGCFYVDKEMLEAGVATEIKDKVTRECSSEKYGPGALISFKKIPANADYTAPADNTLMIAHGYWEMQEGKNIFICTEIEPFF